MSGQDVDDHGLQTITKSALPLTPGNKSQYKIRTHISGGDVFGSGLLQLTYLNLQGLNLDLFTMINDNNEVLVNDVGQLIKES